MKGQRPRSSKSTVDSPSQSARVLRESGVAASSGLESLAPVEESVFVGEPRPNTGGQVKSIASPPILSAEDLHLRFQAVLEFSPPMPHLEPYWKDNLGFQSSDSLMDDPSRPLQLRTSDKLGSYKSPPRLHHKLASVAESELSDVVVIGLDRPLSDDVQENILSSSSSKDEGHLNLPATESEVGTRSSEIKDPQVEQAVAMDVGNYQSAPSVDTAVSETMCDVEVTFKPSTAGKLLSASSARPDSPPDAAPGSVDVPSRPEEASQGRH